MIRRSNGWQSTAGGETVNGGCARAASSARSPVTARSGMTTASRFAIKARRMSGGDKPRRCSTCGFGHWIQQDQRDTAHREMLVLDRDNQSAGQ